MIGHRLHGGGLVFQESMNSQEGTDVPGGDWCSRRGLVFQKIIPRRGLVFQESMQYATMAMNLQGTFFPKCAAN